MKTLLWWGRFDPAYSRNGILRQLAYDLDYQIIDFHPVFSSAANIEASIRGIARPDLVWVPCFRQRDILAASRWAHSRGIPVIFDPLISAWDKQVFERKKFDINSIPAHKLLKQEQKQFQSADTVIADTEEHARFFSQSFHIKPENIKVIHVGADESLFQPDKQHITDPNKIEILFYGSFINLQGPQTIIEAAKICKDNSIHWHLLGNGPLLEHCKVLAGKQSNITFEDWVEYSALPVRIQQADILLGVFGSSEKAGRVIPNKVYQAMACARPVITRASNAYAADLKDGSQSGLFQIKENNPQALLDAVMALANNHNSLPEYGHKSRASYERYFSSNIIKNELYDAVSGTLTMPIPNPH
ncbi:MAG: glycosyltransferase family 4 protein [Gammaproteobacteria bacterium]|nr:glycosyltransferase family 4 protein [Gammaproteobacteria bacterium]